MEIAKINKHLNPSKREKHPVFSIRFGFFEWDVIDCMHNARLSISCVPNVYKYLAFILRMSIYIQRRNTCSEKVKKNAFCDSNIEFLNDGFFINPKIFYQMLLLFKKGLPKCVFMRFFYSVTKNLIIKAKTNL
jgi:hypothetical protein